jgi:hypothetical protein
MDGTAEVAAYRKRSLMLLPSTDGGANFIGSDEELEITAQTREK